MIYPITIETLKDTTQSIAKRSHLRVSKGLVYFIEIYFPSGSEGLLHIAIFDGGFQVWPTAFGSSFNGDDIHFFYDDLYIKNIAPFEFQIYTWNLDDMYAHSVIFRVGLVTKDIFISRFLPSMMYKEFEKVYVNILKEQEKRKLAILKTPFFPIMPGVK